MSHVLLIVEDNELIRIPVAEYFRDAGFKVIEAVDAAQAQALINEVGSIDLVFTDIQMPGEIDGYALALWLERHWHDIPVVLTSGTHRPFIHPSSHYRRFVPKPYGLPDVERHIQELLAISTSVEA